jgi:hypothetical protein
MSEGDWSQMREQLTVKCNTKAASAQLCHPPDIALNRDQRADGNL